MIADFLKQLRTLPYADMMLVAKQLSEILNRQAKLNVSSQLMAASLAEMSGMPIEDSLSTREENKILRELFRVKRTLTVKEFNGGFKIDLPTLHGNMMHKDLRQGISQMLDTMVAARSLTGGK
jgi:hypothetical protein